MPFLLFKFPIPQLKLNFSIYLLQGAARLFGSSISSEDLISVSGVGYIINFLGHLFWQYIFLLCIVILLCPDFHGVVVFKAIPQEVTEALYEACKSGDFDLANKEVNNIIDEGYPVSQILAQVPFILSLANFHCHRLLSDKSATDMRFLRVI
jgi:replication factor C subunit 2/4